MQLRTAYCLNALFQRRGSTRLLNTLYSRIDIRDGSALCQRMIVSTPVDAATHLRAALAAPHRLLPEHNGARTLIAPITFTVEGLIHEPFKADAVVEAVTVKFFDCDAPSQLTFDESFLKVVVHCDAMPDPAGPSIYAFLDALDEANDDWGAMDFLRELVSRQAA